MKKQNRIGNTTEILNSNMEKVLVSSEGSIRKPAKTIFDYEFDFSFSFNTWKADSYGQSLYLSLLKAFSALFTWKNLPSGIRSSEFELFLNQSGRLKVIKIGSIFYPVHITMTKRNNYGDYIESRIVEPYLKGINGKKTELFENIEIKNNVLGTSLIRLIFPFIETIDETLYNLDMHQQILSGKYIYLTDQTKNKDEREREEDSANEWFTNGKPIKTFSKSLLEDGKIPLHKIEIDDTTQSFLSTIQYNQSQMLNVLGIPNNNVEGKSERLITSEINIQNIIQSSIVDDMLEMRKRFVEEFNKKFNLDISVELRNDILIENKIESEGGENE